MNGSNSLDTSMEAQCGSQIKKKKRKFKPRTKPRYIPGSVETAVARGDLKEYNNHLYRVFWAKPRVDDNPPQFHPAKFLKVPNLISAMNTLRQIDIQNKLLLQKINKINRSIGYIDSFNRGANNNCSKWFQRKAIFKRINKHNIELYKKLVQAQTDYSKAGCDIFWKYMLGKICYGSKYPLVILNLETTDGKLRECPSITNFEVSEPPSSTDKLNRPKIYLEFKVDKHVNTIGRIIFELYNDVCPKTVENFLSLCRGKNDEKLTYKNCPVHKIYPNKFCAMGDITKGNGKGGISIFGEYFDAENFELSHSRPGVLSMSCPKENQVSSLFCITFSPMPEFNDKKVVFGKCIRGSEFLRKLSEMGGVHTGKPVVPIIISKCGIVKPKRKIEPIKEDIKPKKNFIKLNIKAVQ